MDTSDSVLSSLPGSSILSTAGLTGAQQQAVMSLERQHRTELQMEQEVYKQLLREMAERYEAKVTALEQQLAEQVARPGPRSDTGADLEQVDRLRGQLRAQERDIDDLLQRLQDSEAEVLQLKRSIRDERKRRDAQQNSHRVKDLDELEQHLADMRKQTTADGLRIVQLQRELDSKEEEVYELQRKQNAAESAARADAETIKRGGEDQLKIIKLQRTVDDQSEQIARLEKKLFAAEARAELSEVQHSADKEAKHRIERLQDKLDRKDEDILQLQQKLSDTKAKLTAAEAKLEMEDVIDGRRGRASESVEHLQQELAAKEEELFGLRRKVVDLQNRDRDRDRDRLEGRGSADGCSRQDLGVLQSILQHRLLWRGDMPPTLVETLPLLAERCSDVMDTLEKLQSFATDVGELVWCFEDDSLPDPSLGLTQPVLALELANCRARLQKILELQGHGREGAPPSAGADPGRGPRFQRPPEVGPVHTIGRTIGSTSSHSGAAAAVRPRPALSDPKGGHIPARPSLSEAKKQEMLQQATAKRSGYKARAASKDAPKARPFR